MISATLTFINGQVDIALVPVTEEDVKLLELATKGRTVAQIKDGDQASKIFILKKDKEA